jgi:hypothetical protein
LHHKANPQIKFQEQFSPLDIATELKHQGVITLLEQCILKKNK